jgi:phage regulator Rha-like protein
MEIFRDLESEIVFAKKEDVFTSSKVVADEFNRRHDSILRLVDECISDLQVISNEAKHTSEELNNLPTMLFKKVDIKAKAGVGVRKSHYYEMNRSAFMFFMMKVQGKKADIYKLRFIHAFNTMEQWIKDRAVGRGVRLSMTDSIKNYLPESPNKKFKYKHFTDLVYKKVFGMNKKQLQAELGHEVDNLRDICTTEELQRFVDYENEISVLLKYGSEYKEIKEMLT